MPAYSYRKAADPDTFRALRHGVVGSWGEWIDACRLALEKGWSESEIGSVLFWYHPATWMWAGICLLVAVVAVFRLAEFLR